MSRSRAMTYSKAITVAALGPVLALSLTACGGGSSTATVTPQANATGAPSAGPGGGRAGGFLGGADGAKIQACLKAAGVSLPTGRAFPRPSGSFVRPTGVRPSGGAGGRGFGGGGFFSDPQIQAALKACGIAVPTFGPRPSGAPTA